MFADHTLTPKEATRLCALGSLARSPMTYSALAMAIRHFIGRGLGPTPEIMGHSLELLKNEGIDRNIVIKGDRHLVQRDINPIQPENSHIAYHGKVGFPETRSIADYHASFVFVFVSKVDQSSMILPSCPVVSFPCH